MKENGRYSLNISGKTYEIDPHSQEGVSKTVNDAISEIQERIETPVFHSKLRRNGHGMLRRMSQIQQIQKDRAKIVARDSMLQRHVQILKNDIEGRIEFVVSKKGEIVGLKVS